MRLQKVPYLIGKIKKKILKSIEFKSNLVVLRLNYIFTTWLNTTTWNTFTMTSQSILASNGIPKRKKESIMTRLLKVIASTLVMVSMVFAVPTETVENKCSAEYAVQQDGSETIVASADVKKKKKKGKKIGGSKGKKSKKGFFSKIFGSK